MENFIGAEKIETLEHDSVIAGLTDASIQDLTELIDAVKASENSFVTADSIRVRILKIAETSGKFDEGDVFILIEDVKTAVDASIELHLLPLPARVNHRRRLSN